MKFLHSFLFVVFAFLSLGLFGQTTVTVGTGTATDYNFPLQPYFNYGWSSQIYTATEIGTSGTINSIAYYVNNSGSSYTLDNQKIYMRQTTSTQHADKYYPTTTGFTLVYSGSVTIGASGWKTITLSTPFTYSNTSNLEILVESRDGSTFTSAVQTRYTSKSDYRTKYDYNDYAFPSTWYAGGRVTKLPNIQFVINTCTAVAGSVSTTTPTICAGNTASLTLNGQTAGQNIQWQESTDNLTFTDIIGASSTTSTTFTTPALTSIKYYRAKVGSGSCIVYSNVQTISVTALPATPTSTNNGPLCAGSTLNLTASTITGATYAWTGPNSFTSTSQNPSIATITTAGAGTYSVTATVNGCTSVAGTTSVTVNAIPTTPTAGNNGALCAGSTLNLTASTIAGATYSWTGPNGFTSTSQNPTITNITTAGAGTYSVTATVNGCTSVVGTTSVAVNAIPSTPTLGNNGPLCAGSTLNLTASTLAGATYSWTGPNGFTSNSQNPTITNITTAGAGTYSVTATVNGCTSVAGTTSVAVNAIPSSPTIGNNGPLCAGSTLNLTASTLAGATYSWTGPNGFTSTSQNPTITNITTAGAGTYTISTTLNGCTSATSSTNVVVLLNTVGTLSSNKSNVCVGENISLTTIGQNVSANLVWEKSEDNQNYTVINGESNSILNVTNLSNSTSFRVRYNLTGCTQELSNTINIQVSNIQNTITSNKTEVCPGEKVLLTSNDLNANNTITWFSSLNGVDYSPILNSNSIFYNSNSLEQNTYFKSIKTDNICSKESNTILVTVTCSVKSNLISGEQTGILSIDLTSKPDKVGPFYYIVQEETVLPLSDILANTPQFLETATFNTKLDLVNIPEGQYNVVVYDSRGVALINDKVNFYAPIEFVDANTFTVNNNTVIANSTISSGSINQVITKETNSVVKYKIADPSKFNFVGFQDVNTGLNQLSDLKYGYSLQDNKLYAVENGNLIDLQIQAYPNMEFEIRQNSSDIELWHNNSLLRKFTNRYDDFTYNESFSLDQFGSIQHFGTGMEKICLECVPDINIKTSLNSCLEDNGTIEIELISNGATISSVKLFDSSNQLIQKDLSSKTLYYVYKNLVPGIYKVQYDYKYNYQRNYWLESSNRSVTREINVDSKLNWNQYSNTIYSSNDESIKGKLGLINNFGSATSLNEARLDDKVYYIDFELNSFWARQNPSSKTILSWDDNVNPNSISNSDLLITRFENSYLNQFQIGSQKWNLNKIENDERPFEFNENGIRITYRYLYSYQFNSTNNTVSLIRKNLTNQTSKILIGPVTLSTNQQVRTIHFFTNYENTGLKNVKSNLNCKVISYVKLEREIKGMNYKPISNIIYFYYDEEYSNTTSLSYRVLDLKNQEVMSTTTNNLIKKYGDNRYSLDVQGLNVGSYILEVRNDKNEKFYLRFTK